MNYLNYFLRWYVALDHKCQSGDEKTTFAAKIANDIATVDWLNVDIRTHAMVRHFSVAKIPIKHYKFI